MFAHALSRLHAAATAAAIFVHVNIFISTVPPPALPPPATKRAAKPKRQLKATAAAAEKNLHLKCYECCLCERRYFGDLRYEEYSSERRQTEQQILLMD